MPSLLERRSDSQSGNRGLLSLHDLDDSSLSPVVSPILTRRNIRGPPTVSGFAPLPPITASPVCTPTASVATASSLPRKYTLSSPSLDTSSSSQSTSSYLTPPTTPSDNSHQLPVPTWVAVPPTPSTQLLFRSLTSTSRKSRPHIPASASSPVAHFSHNARPLFNRRASFPTLKIFDPVDSAPPPPPPMSSTADTPVRRTTKRLFQLADDGGSDSEDIQIPFTTSPRNEDSYFSLEPSDERGITRRKDRLRRFHALLEVLTTEMAYLTDLRVLVKVYLRILSTWTCKGSGAFSRTSSFTSASRVNSASHLHLHPNNLAPLSAIDTKLSPGKEKDKRFMFSSSDMGVLSRNIEDVLQLHERFVDELHALMAVLDFPIPSNESEAEQFRQDPDPWLSKVDDATRAVSSKFATEASRFNSYQTFCAGHSEALSLVHKAQHQYTSDWAAFQQCCSAEMLIGDDSSESPGPQPAFDSALSDRSHGGTRSRTISTSSTDSFVNIVRRSRTNTASSDITPDLSAKAKNSRLNFTDYLIKPVQRICKYPLLLDQLRSRGVEDKLAEDMNVVVQSATQAMRHVASSVDEARHRQDVAIQTSLIALRMSAALSLANAFYSSSSCQSIDVLTPSFISSLGTCLLSGSLDILHSKGTAVPKSAKYFAVFLYAGYIVLAKVKSKAHYEPRHWFPLSLMTVTDVSSEEAIFPHSFRLAHHNHQFELAASCQGEKAVWLSTLRKSLTPVTTWINEPTPSLFLSNKGDAGTRTSEAPSAWTMGSTEMTWTEPTPVVLEDVPRRYVASDDGHTTSRSNSMSKVSRARSPPRRSSTTSIKARFYNTNSPSASPTMTINRFSSAARYTVDHALQDVISESCGAARAHASTRDEDFFPISAGLTRSKTSSTTINRLSRHESVRVPRRQSFVEAMEAPMLRPIQSRVPSSPTSQPNSATIPSSDESVPPLTWSTRSATPNSIASNPVIGNRNMTQPRRTTRSMVGDLRELFVPRSPTSTSSRRSSLADNTKPNEDTVPRTSSFAIFRKWTRAPKHRRTHSVPGRVALDADRIPETTCEPPIPVLPDLDFGLRLSTSPPRIS